MRPILAVAAILMAASIVCEAEILEQLYFQAQSQCCARITCGQGTSCSLTSFTTCGCQGPIGGPGLGGDNGADELAR
ncbi:hypothetical protein DPMN_120421 [Dreissena polymorpha]|uniref:Uncharacterized protein n=1 Tax=Dreissena polymorpha TaxID=45954 RepID=A0A9D4GNI3_DREPO|nr:hypothetical protein DPMN_120421 [Dreissena polymorpha]